jgi:hypothetical protein
MAFVKATKKQAKARVALSGPPGSGKTYSSLAIAAGLGGKVAVIDTERKSASKYADSFNFDVCELEEHSIDSYVQAIKDAADAGYDVLVIDSMSHEWVGRGGALETVDKVGGSNKFTNGWGKVTPMHNRFVDAVLSFPGHVIATLRTKTEYVIEQQGGKSVPRKVGLAPVQRDGVEYEFDVVGDLSIDNVLTITKSRCSALQGKVIEKPGKQIADALSAWLSDGAPALKVEAPPAPPADAVAAWRQKIQEASSAEALEAVREGLAAQAAAVKDAVRADYKARQAELGA